MTSLFAHNKSIHRLHKGNFLYFPNRTSNVTKFGALMTTIKRLSTTKINKIQGGEFQYHFQMPVKWLRTVSSFPLHDYLCQLRWFHHMPSFIDWNWVFQKQRDHPNTNSNLKQYLHCTQHVHGPFSGYSPISLYGIWFHVAVSLHTIKSLHAAHWEHR